MSVIFSYLIKAIFQNLKAWELKLKKTRAKRVSNAQELIPEKGRLDRSEYRENWRRFCLCCFVI